MSAVLAACQACLSEYHSCPTPSLDNPKAVTHALCVFQKIGLLHAQAMSLQLHRSQPYMLGLVREIDGAHLFACTMLPVLTAAALVVQADGKSADSEQLLEQWGILAGLGIELSISASWRAFYTETCNRLVELAFSKKADAASEKTERNIPSTGMRSCEPLPVPTCFEEYLKTFCALVERGDLKQAIEFSHFGHAITKTPAQERQFLNSRASAYLKLYTTTPSLEYLRGSIANLMAAWKKHKHCELAVFALELLRCIGSQVLEPILKEYEAYDVMWECANALRADQRVGEAEELLRAFPILSLRYAAQLAQSQKWDQLKKWSLSSWLYVQESPIAFFDLLGGLVDHHEISRSDMPDLAQKESVRRRLENARSLFPIAQQDPHWASVLSEYFPQEFCT